MKKLRGSGAVGFLLVLVATSRLEAQPVPPAATAAAPPAAGLVGLCQMLEQKIQACKAKICACPLGQLLTNGQSVGNLFLGGLCCPPCCPLVNPNDLKQASDTPAGACARFKQDQLTMPARRDAVRCLAYADCHWWPEAQAALLTALRTDKNECVRLEAAKVLYTGCCCTARVIETLAIVVSGSSRDGNPSENSPRVKAAAMAALQHCIDCYSEQLPEPERPERAPVPKAVADGRIQPVAEADPLAKAVANARRILADSRRRQPQPLPGAIAPGQQSLFHIAAVTFGSQPAPARPPSREPGVLGIAPTADPQSGMPPSGSRSLFEVAHNAWHRPSEVPTPMPPVESLGHVLDLPPEPQPPPLPAELGPSTPGRDAENGIPPAASGE